MLEKFKLALTKSYSTLNISYMITYLG